MTERDRVLIVDDDRMILEALGLGLQDSYDLRYAIDGHEAMMIFEREHIDCVILDFAMPNVDGVELIRRIRIVDGGKTPLIVLSAHNQQLVVDYASELGADLYLNKPIAPSALKGHVEKVLKARRDK